MFVLPAGVALIVGMAAGLARLGLLGETGAARLTEIHAPAMIFGFVGSLVVLERAVAIRRRWAFAAPLLLSLGALSLLAPVPVAIGRTAIVVGFVAILAIYRVIWKRQSSIATSVQVLGAACGLIAALLWLAGVPFASFVPVAEMFLVLTIVGERIELGRVGGLTHRGEVVGIALSLLVAALSLSTVLWPAAGYVLLGISVLALVGWLLAVDVARATISARGAARYMAACLLCGYLWLAVAGAIWLVGGPPGASAAYDATTHAVLLGFVMSMIMAHASVILPAVLRIALPYRPEFYVAVGVLQLSVLVRLVGDARGSDTLVQAGGIGNVTAIVLFLVLAVVSAARATRSPSRKSAAPQHPTPPSAGRTSLSLTTQKADDAQP